MERAREILGVRQDWLGFVDSGLPEGDPLPPLPEGCFALVPLEEAAEPLVAADPRVPAARASRRTTRTAATRTPTTSCATRSRVAAFEAAGDPDALPGRGRAVAAAEALLPPRLQPGAHRGAPRRDARRTASSRRTRSGSSSWERDARAGTRRITTRVPCARLLRRSATRRCSRTPPRSTRTARWFAVPLRAPARRSGRPRTSSWSPAASTTALPEDDLFAGIRGLSDRGPRLRQWSHAVARPPRTGLSTPCPTTTTSRPAGSASR